MIILTNAEREVDKIQCPFMITKWVWGDMCVCAQLFNYVQLFATPWTIACQAPLSKEFFQARILEWLAISSSRGPF